MQNKKTEIRLGLLGLGTVGSGVVKILQANAKLLGLDAPDEALAELSQRSRGTPRIANRLLRRARDYAVVEGKGKMTVPIVRGTKFWK